MAVLTNFLKLLKPEKNDYVDVDKHISENYDKIDNKIQELDKKASKTQLGRVKIGDNLTITEDGTLSGNPEYTHPTGAGYKHIPAGGAVGQVLKNNGDGSAEWGTLDIKDKLNRGNLPATVPDGKTIYDLLENNGGLNIDTALLYLNDSGTKTKGKVYFDRNKKGLFECIQTTTATTNSTTYFVDISNKANSDRFGNLIEVIITGSAGSLSKEQGSIFIKNNYYKKFQILHSFREDFPFEHIYEVEKLENTYIEDAPNQTITMQKVKELGGYSIYKVFATQGAHDDIVTIIGLL